MSALEWLEVLGWAGAYTFVGALFCAVWCEQAEDPDALGVAILAAMVWPIASPLWAGAMLGCAIYDRGVGR